MKKIALSLVAFITFSMLPFGQHAFVYANSISQSDVSSLTKTLVDDLKTKQKKLEEMANTYNDDGMKKLSDRFKKLVSNLDGRDYKLDGNMNDMAKYNKTGSLADPSHNAIWVGNEFFNNNQYLYSQDANNSQNIIKTSQQAILLHEAVHMEQSLFSKGFETIKSIYGWNPLPVLTGDSNEVQAYTEEYMMLRLLGGDMLWKEAGKSRLLIKENGGKYFSNSDSKSEAELFEQSMGLKDTFGLFDNGIEAAYQDLKDCLSTLPEGANTKIRLKLKVTNSKNQPFAGIGTTLTAIDGSMNNYISADTNGMIFTGYYDFMSLVKTFKLKNTYKFVARDKKRSSILATFTGKQVCKGKLQKDKDGFYTFDLGTGTFYSDDEKIPDKSLKLKVQDQKGGLVPLSNIQVNGAYTAIANNMGLLFNWTKSFAGKLFVQLTMNVDEPTTGTKSNITRYIMSDEGENTIVANTYPLPERFDRSWTSTTTIDEKRKAIGDYLNKLNEIFKLAIDQNGIVTGLNTTSISLADYSDMLSRVPTIPAFASDLYNNMLKTQDELLNSRYKELSDKLKEKSDKKLKIDAIISSSTNQFVKDPRILCIKENENIYTSYDIEVLNSLELYYKEIYIEVIDKYSEYLKQMDEYFKDPTLFELKARLIDLGSYKYSNINPNSDFKVSATFDSYLYTERATLYPQILSGMENVIASFDRQIKDVLSARNKELEKETQINSNSASLISNIEGKTKELEGKFYFFEKHSPYAIADRLTTIGPRLNHYINVYEGKEKADVAWGYNYTVTNLHDDIHIFYNIVKGLNGLNNIDSANQKLDYTEATLSYHLATINKNIPVILKYFNDAKVFGEQAANLRNQLDVLPSNLSPELEKRRQDVYMTLSKFTISIYGNDALIQSSIDSIGKGEKWCNARGNTASLVADNTPPKDDIKIKVNGSYVYPDVAPQIFSGRTMVPVRVVSEALKCTVNWRDSDKTVIINSPNKAPSEVPTGSGSLRVVVDGKEIISDVQPVIVDGRTMIPFRFVAEAIGAVVGWDGDSKTVKIDMQGQ